MNEDVTEANDLAAKMPDKLKEMQDVFYAEAKKYNVLPLDNSTLARFLTPRPSSTAGRKVFEYTGQLAGTPPSCAPNIMAKDYTIEAQVEIPEGGAEGMIVTEGGRFGGYGLFLSKGDWASVGATWCSSTTCSISSARCGKGRNSSRANTPYGSTSNMTAQVSAKVAQVSYPWTASR